MKKILSFLIVVAFIFSGLTAHAQIPEALTKSYNNYTADYSLSFQLENADQIVDLIKESIPDEGLLKVLDLNSVFSSLLSLDATANIKANISDDYKKMQLSATTDYFYDVTTGENMVVSLKATAGTWLNMDISAPEPVFELIHTYPYSNKYIRQNILEECTEGEKAQIVTILNLVLNKEFIDSINSTTIQLLEKHAKTTVAGNTCTIELDNEGLIALIEDFIAVFGAKMSALMPFFTEAASIGIIGGADGPTAIYTTEDTEAELPPEALFPSLEGVQLLGKEGIVCKYTLTCNHPSKAEMDVDISINLSELLGDEWESDKPLNIDFSVRYDTNMSNFGTTKVDFPVLTEENSVNYNELFDFSSPAYVGDYPMNYVWFETNRILLPDNLYYLPLRQTMTEAYGDEITIGYQDGKITLQSPWFTEFETLTFYENSTRALIDEKEITISPILEQDGTAYISWAVLEELFDWSGLSITHDMRNETYSIDFYTYDINHYEAPETSYPYYYAAAKPTEVPVIDGKYYVPLRELIYDAYADQATIEYADGVITLQSQWFPGFKKLTLYEDSTTAYKDETEITVDRVIVKDGVTYVSYKFFEDIFDWTLDGISHDIISDWYYVDFYTDAKG